MTEKKLNIFTCLRRKIKFCFYLFKNCVLGYFWIYKINMSISNSNLGFRPFAFYLLHSWVSLHFCIFFVSIWCWNTDTFDIQSPNVHWGRKREHRNYRDINDQVDNLILITEHTATSHSLINWLTMKVTMAYLLRCLGSKSYSVGWRWIYLIRTGGPFVVAVYNGIEGSSHIPGVEELAWFFRPPFHVQRQNS